MKIVSRAILLTLSLLIGTHAYAETLRVVTLHSPPIAFEDADEIRGVGVDVVREALRRMGHEMKISIIPWKRAMFMTQYGDADAIFYAVKNEEREHWFHYPQEHLVNETTVMLKRTGEELGIEPEKLDYPHLRLGVGRGYYYGPKLTNFLENANFGNVEEATTIESNFGKLVERRIDVFVSDLALAEYFIQTTTSPDVISIVANPDGTPLILDSVKSYLAFSQATMTRKMADDFSTTLQKMKQDGSYDTILNKYR